MPEKAHIPPTNIDRYEFITRLATGGMAELFLARERGIAGLERLVVIKRILPHLAEQSSFVDMFLREARIVARLNHPNIVQVYELGQHDGAYYIAMEYIHGSTVRELQLLSSREEKPFPLGVSLGIIEQSCRGLHAAHELRDLDGASLGLVHRDVSPQNLMCTMEGHIKLLDFGVAKASEGVDATYSGNLKGKFAYLSPEQCMHQELDRRSDLFSLGIILWEMCTGHRLFKRRTELEMMQAVIKGDIPSARSLNNSIAPELDQVILRALSLDREQRYDTAEQMRQAILEVSRQIDVTTGDDAIATFLKSIAGHRLSERQATLQSALDRSLTSNERKHLLHMTGSTSRASADPDEHSVQTAIERPGGAEGSFPSVSVSKQSPRPLTLPKKELPHPSDSLSISRERIESWQVDEVSVIRSSKPLRRGIIGLLFVALLASVVFGSNYWVQLLEMVSPSAQDDSESTAILIGTPLPLGWAPIITPDALVREIQPLHQYLEESTGRPMPLVFARDYNDLSRMLVEGEVAFAILPPLLYVQTKAKAPEVELLALKEYDGGTHSDALLLVSTQSRISKLEDLEGKRFCFTDRSSTSGNFLPRAFLRSQGHDPESFIGEIHWSGDHMQAIKDLVSGQCDATATYSGAFLSADDFGVPMGQIRALAVTGHLPQDTFTAGPQVAPADRQRVREALLNFHPQTHLGMRRLGETQRITGFAKTSDEDFENLRNALQTESGLTLGNH